MPAPRLPRTRRRPGPLPAALRQGGAASPAEAVRLTWIVVLVKDFDTAKQRLTPALSPPERRRLAVANALRALAAARATGRPVLAVCGSLEAEAAARGAGVETLLEAAPAGQNPAAQAGIARVVESGGEAVLLLSSDLPLVDAAALAHVLQAGERLGPRAVVAAAATGRGGTNALYLRPPDAVGLHFGDDSLPKFEADARARGADFEVLELDALALDLDEPSDLWALRARA